MMAAPLIAGNDLHNMDKDILQILINKKAVAVDQDKLGIQCFLWSKANGIETWIKPLADGSFAVCFLNRGTKPLALDFNCQQKVEDPDFHKSHTIDGSYSIFDIWGNKDLGTTAKNITSSINGHDVLFVLLKKK
jgi:alpha-galactosidase